jgi:hypothetical protein
MERKVLIFILILLLFCYSCWNTSKEYSRINNFKSRVNYTDYQWGNYDLKKIYKNLIGTRILYPEATDVYGYCGIFLLTNFDSTEYVSFNNNYLRTHERTWIYDTCNRYITDPITNNPSCNKVYKPVPDISEESPLLDGGIIFSDSSFFIVLETEVGNYLPSEIQSISHSNNMKNNGFSKGLLLDDKNMTILFYVMIWNGNQNPHETENYTY